MVPGGAQLISINKSPGEMERLEELQQAAAACYALAVRSTAQYAIEIEPGQAEGFRRHLEALQERLEAAATVEEVQAVQSSFRGELRDYRDKAKNQIARLRKEVEVAGAWVENLASSVAANGADHEHQVKEQLSSLRTAAASDNLERIRSGIQAAATGILTSFEQMRESNQLVVAQLKDEIRALHQEIESERRALFTDRPTGVWNRQKMDLRIDDLLRQNQPFCLLLVCVRDLKRLESQRSPALIEQLLKGFLARFQGLLEADAMVGRWSEDQFAAILDIDAASAITISRKLVRELSANYTVQENGQSHGLKLQATAGVADPLAAGDAKTFRNKLAQLAAALAGA
jgi:GGDEF domain-containing protein